MSTEHLTIDRGDEGGDPGGKGCWTECTGDARQICREVCRKLNKTKIDIDQDEVDEDSGDTISSQQQHGQIYLIYVRGSSFQQGR